MPLPLVATIGWPAGHDAELLAHSFRRFVGTARYDPADLQVNPDRLASLLGDQGHPPAQLDPP